jgi:hypothetical protein
MMLIKVFVANFVRAANLKHKEKDSSWTKAKEGFVTVNVDVGFFFLDKREGSMGAVILGDRGSFIAASNNNRLCS